MKLLINYYNMKLQYHIFVQKKEKKRKANAVAFHMCSLMCIRFRTCEMRHLNQAKRVFKDQTLFKTKLIRRCVFSLGFAAELILLSWIPQYQLIRRCVFSLGFAAELILLSWYCGILNLWRYIIQIIDWTVNGLSCVQTTTFSIVARKTCSD